MTACLKAIDENTEGDYEVVIVDNGTGWSMVGVPNVGQVIRNPENLGYAKACNQGVEASRGSFVCLLNMDTEVQPGWMAALLTAFYDPNVAMAGPRIVHPAGDLQTAGIRTWHGNGSAGGEEIKADLPSREVDGVTGACAMMRRDIYLALGGMYEGYWAGNEDTDLCLTTREAGHIIRYVQNSNVIHHEGASGAARWIRVHENVALLNERWGNR